jgi:transcriptional regulator with XRE-family HTH domain
VNDINLVPQPYFGERLRLLRQQRGLKQTDLADSGLSASYISRIESGHRAATVQAAQVLARRLGVELSIFQSSHDVDLARLLSDAQTSLAAGDHAGAASAFEAALAECVTDPPFALVWLIHHSLAIAHCNLGRRADWQRHERELVALATRAQSPDLLVQAHIGLSSCLRQSGDVGGADTAAQQAYLHSHDADVSPGHRLEAIIAMIAAEAETGRATTAARRADELLDLLDDSTPAPDRAKALWAAATANAAAGGHEKGTALLEQAMAGLRIEDDPVTWARLRLTAVSLRRRAGRTIEPEVRAWFDEAAAVLRVTAIPIYRAQLDFLEAQIAFDEGRYDDAQTLCESALAQSDVLSFRDRARAEMQLAQATAALGERDRAVRDLRAIAQRLDDADARNLSAEAWRLVAELALAGQAGGA